MKAEKITVTIKFEALSIDSLPAMISQMQMQISSEVESGLLRMSDGDEIKWDTKRTPIEF